ncbi:MAG: DUF2202 domain-containing protein [Chloroflexi bacterium]|nr:DUF2202 domain-containing protein [Chloroflexota bacterium]
MHTKLKPWKVLLAGLAVLTLGLAVCLPGESVAAAALDGRGGPGGWGGNGQSGGAVAPGSGLALTPLSEAEASALHTAILEEYGALNLYNAVIDQFGSVAPFSLIALSEQQHVDALVYQAEKYGVAVPANPGLSSTALFDDLSAACQAGVEAEIADGALYDELKAVTTHSDLLNVYDRLQSASLNSHLPAFQACGG